MNIKFKSWINIFIVILSINANSQKGAKKSIAELLGYPANTKLLIIHADDLGVSHSENMASIKSIENGLVNSASIMVPCPWFPEIATYAKKSKDINDFGLHLTLTSEWKNYKWGPLASKNRVSSLVNEQGYFYSTVDSLLHHVKPDEAEIEIRKQVETSIMFGIDITHLDAHMYALRSDPELLKRYIKVGREFKLPVLLSFEEEMLQRIESSISLNEKDVVVDKIYIAVPDDHENGLINYYTNVLMNLKPGLSCLLIHTAYDDEEMRAVTIDYSDWGAAWRQADFDFFNSERCKKLLKSQNIQLVTWRELRDKIVRTQ